MSLSRTALLSRLPAAIAETARELEAAIVRERGFPIAAVRRDRAFVLADAARALELPDPAAGRLPLAGDPGDEVLCVVPYNVGYWALIPILNCLAPGNRVRLRFPRGTEQTSAAILRLLRLVEPADWIVVDDRPGVELARAAAEDPRVRGVCLYGSDRAGRGYCSAAEAGKVVLFEGPGNDPLLVMRDAPRDIASRITALKYAYGSGQACVAPERVLVESSRYAESVEGLATAADQLRCGDPADPRVDVGPIMNDGVVRRLREQVEDALTHGAEIVAGAVPVDGHVRPTVVAGLTPAMRVMEEEVFGPVLYVARVDDGDEAVALATASPLGLSASVWGKADGSRIAARLRGAPYLEQVDGRRERKFGLVGLNENANANSLHAPFGGYGDSGWVWRPDAATGVPTTWQGPKHVSVELSAEAAVG